MLIRLCRARSSAPPIPNLQYVLWVVVIRRQSECLACSFLGFFGKYAKRAGLGMRVEHFRAWVIECDGPVPTFPQVWRT